MLTERLLPPHEWPRLSGTLMDPAWQTLSHSDKVIVVEDDGEIIACTSLSQHWHLEGSWIHPAYRQRVSVGRRLLKTIRALCQALHVGEVFMMATNPESAAMCQKLGYQSMALPPSYAAIVEKGRPVVWQAQ